MVIIGSKGCAKEILTALKWDNVEETVSLFDNISTDISDAYYDFPIIKSWNELEQHLKTDSKVIIGVGGGQRREVLALKDCLSWRSIDHFYLPKSPCGRV